MRRFAHVVRFFSSPTPQAAMRLTLRTMLAYLDDILEPQDAAEIAQKIEDSEFARGLVHRIRDVTQRPRLEAPPLEGGDSPSGQSLDPNVVAEYLDNTLPPDRVPDFERICLESDMHLAEVACSHQVLTMVLGEPAQIDAESRRRMYTLPARSAEGVDPATASTVPEPKSEAVLAGASDLGDERPPGWDHPAAARTKPQVPDYLRQGEARSAGKFKALAVAVIAIAAAVLVFLAFQRGNAIHRFVFGPEQLAENDNPPQPAEGANSESDTPAPKTGVRLPPPDPNGGVVPSPDGGGAPDRVGPAEPINPPTLAGDSKPTPGATDAVAVPSAVATDDGPPLKQPDGVPNPAEGTTEPVEPMPPSPDGDQVAKATDPPAIIVPKQERVGEVGVDRHVLLVSNEADAKTRPWRRLPARTPLFSGDRLLALPTFRPTATLAAGMSMKLGSETAVRLLDSDEEGVPGLEILYGRVKLMRVGVNDLKLRIVIGGQTHELIVADGDLALDVQPQLRVGTDPEKGARPATVDLYVLRGNVQWRTPDSTEVESLAAPRHRALAGPARAESDMAADFPKGIIDETISDVEQRARGQIEPAIATDKPVQLSLMELAGHRQREVRSLAVRSLGIIGKFDPFIESLSDDKERTAWLTHVEALQEAVQRDPQAAALVHEALRKRHPRQADKLFQMLWPQNEESLNSGMAQRLVESLSSNELIDRVIASSVLKQITGLGLYYSPEDTAAERASAVRRWEDRLRKGEVVPKGGGRTPSSTTPAAESPDEAPASPAKGAGGATAVPPLPPIPATITLPGR